MHILVTNDDGVQAEGLFQLVQAVEPFGKVSVLAPDRNWSGAGHVKTLHRPLRVKNVLLRDGTAAKASDGAPSDCVALGLLGLLEEPIDLVVSGINPYCNVGHDLTYSGTVTAAMEAVIFGIPGIAFSLDGSPENSSPFFFETASTIAGEVIKTLIDSGLPHDVLLNVNVPNLPLEEIKGKKITRQGLRVYRDELVRRNDPRGIPYYWIGGEAPTGVPEDGTDIGALSEGYVSITPVQMDMTAHSRIADLQTIDWKVEK